MKSEYVAVRMLPVDLLALDTCVKVTGLSRSDIVRHFMRQGIEASKGRKVAGLRSEILDSEAKALGHQLFVNDHGGAYTLEPK